jgi:hypothetical protein
VNAARSRVRRSASESIAEAQARIAAEDAAALAEVHKVRGSYCTGRQLWLHVLSQHAGVHVQSSVSNRCACCTLLWLCPRR